jgi:hypothetical protein
MLDYKARYNFYIEDIDMSSSDTITIDEYIDDEELLFDVLQEKLKDKIDDRVQLTDYECLWDRDFDIYKLTY